MSDPYNGNAKDDPSYQAQKEEKVAMPVKGVPASTGQRLVPIGKRPSALKLDKSRSMKKKKRLKINKKCEQHDSVILENSDKELFQVKTPHLILSNQRFNDIKLNVIMLTNPRLKWNLKNRMIHYDIKYMGKNIHFSKKGRYFNLKPCCTKCNTIYILIGLHEVKHIENVMFFTELGELVLRENLNLQRHGYILLAAMQVSKQWQKNEILITDERYDLIKRYYVNQVKQNHNTYHFGTSGTIFGLGYGPKCHRNKDGHSIDRYSNSE